MAIERTQGSMVPAYLLAALASVPATALAASPFVGLQTPYATWSVSAGAEYTDNATRQPKGPSDTIGTVGVEGGLYRDSGRLRADLDGGLRFEDYLKGTYKSHVLGRMVGLVSYAILPEHLVWVAEDSYGQAVANSFLPTTPQNRINVNTFSTGPDGNVTLGQGNRLTFGARYGQSNFQRNPVAQVDDRRYSGKAGFLHALSPNSLVSLNVATTKVDYLDARYAPYTDTEFFGHYEVRARRVGASIDAGVAQIRQMSSNVSDPVLRLTIFRRLTPSWNLNLGAGTQYTNPSNAFQSAVSGSRVVNGQVVPGAPGQTGSGGPVDINLAQSAHRVDSVSATLDFVRPRTNADLEADLSRDRFVFGTSDLNRNITRYGAGFGHRLRPSLTLHGRTSYEKRTPQGSFFPGDRTTRADLGLDWRTGSMFEITFAFAHEKRAADLGGFGYTDNHVLVAVAYGRPKGVNQFQPAGSGR